MHIGDLVSVQYAGEEPFYGVLEATRSGCGRLQIKYVDPEITAWHPLDIMTSYGRYLALPIAWEINDVLANMALQREAKARGVENIELASAYFIQVELVDTNDAPHRVNVMEEYINENGTAVSPDWANKPGITLYTDGTYSIIIVGKQWLLENFPDLWSQIIKDRLLNKDGVDVRLPTTVRGGLIRLVGQQQP